MVCTRTETICGGTEATQIPIINGAFGGEVTVLSQAENARYETAEVDSFVLTETFRLRKPKDLIKTAHRCAL